MRADTVSAPIRPRPARGQRTRAANKARRRERILTCAGRIVADGGYDALTLSSLAAEADVSIPTIHNLLGRKADIVREMVDAVVARIGEVLSQQVGADPVATIRAFTDALMALYAGDEALYRAAFVAGEREGLFDQQASDGIFQRSLALAVRVCAEAREDGYLDGRIGTDDLAAQLFGAQRLARHDWMHGYIDIDAYRRRVLVGMFTVLAADATPAFRAQLHDEIAALGPAK